MIDEIQNRIAQATRFFHARIQCKSRRFGAALTQTRKPHQPRLELCGLPKYAWLLRKYAEDRSVPGRKT
jgi:hypothetical protein